MPPGAMRLRGVTPQAPLCACTPTCRVLRREGQIHILERESRPPLTSVPVPPLCFPAHQEGGLWMPGTLTEGLGSATLSLLCIHGPHIIIPVHISLLSDCRIRGILSPPLLQQQDRRRKRKRTEGLWELSACRTIRLRWRLGGPKRSLGWCDWQ